MKIMSATCVAIAALSAAVACAQNYPNKAIFREIVPLEHVVFTLGGGREDGPGVSFTATSNAATAPCVRPPLLIETFQEWQQGHANRLAMYSTSYVIREIKVRPDEFARFCDRECCGYDANSMIAFAEAVGGK